jgi:glycerol uptake facilitator-like aquaporin
MGEPRAEQRAHDGRAPANETMAREIVVELLGTAGLACANVGSSLMAARRFPGDDGMELLVTSLATGAALAALIAATMRVGKAHFNPLVTLAALCERSCSAGKLIAFVLAQCTGAFIGLIVAHVMFGVAALSVSTTPHPEGSGLAVGEAVATIGLLLVARGTDRRMIAPFAVGIFIFAAHWWTASTSVVNPALTLARMFTEAKVGMRPADVPLFLLGQAAGAVLAIALRRVLFGTAPTTTVMRGGALPSPSSPAPA